MPALQLLCLGPHWPLGWHTPHCASHFLLAGLLQPAATHLPAWHTPAKAPAMQAPARGVHCPLGWHTPHCASHLLVDAGLLQPVACGRVRQGFRVGRWPNTSSGSPWQPSTGRREQPPPCPTHGTHHARAGLAPAGEQAGGAGLARAALAQALAAGLALAALPIALRVGGVVAAGGHAHACLARARPRAGGPGLAAALLLGRAAAVGLARLAGAALGAGGAAAAHRGGRRLLLHGRGAEAWQWVSRRHHAQAPCLQPPASPGPTHLLDGGALLLLLLLLNLLLLLLLLLLLREGQEDGALLRQPPPRRGPLVAIQAPHAAGRSGGRAVRCCECM